MKTVCMVLFALVALAVPAVATDYIFELKPENTKIEFTLGDTLHTIHGSFSLKRGTIDFNTDTGKASGQVVVDMTSGDSGSNARDSRMHANVLESKKFPEAVFAPDRVVGTFSAAETSSLKVHGLLTIHGAAHEMTMDVQTSGAGDRLRATMTFDIPYVAWGMKDPSNFLLKVSKSVHMTIETGGSLQNR